MSKLYKNKNYDNEKYEYEKDKKKYIKDKKDKKDKKNKKNKKDKKNKKKDKIIFDIKNNITRRIKNYLGTIIDFNKLKGLTYYYLHCFFIFVITFITIFSTSKIELIILLIIITLDAMSIIYLHECPLTTMEKKYLGYTSCEERYYYLKKMDIMYNCDHTYEKQIELLINIWCIIAVKCLIIIFLNMFNIKLIDLNKIYTHFK